jgi:YegS/Rv2252/BmrU family lipid kinase
MNTVVLINAHSRKARKLLPQIKNDFDNGSLPFTVTEFIVVHKKSDFSRIYNALTKMKRIDRLIVGSGDGTITTTLNKLRNDSIVYGFLPLGTCNTFMHNIGLPLDYDKALEIIKNGKPTKVTLGEVNGKLFTCNAAIGVSTRVAEHISDKTKRYLGQVGYIASGTKELLRHRPFECRLQIDHKSLTFKSHQILISNGHYHGHLPLAKSASVYKNQLVLVAFGTDQSRLQHIKSMAKFALNKHRADPSTLIVPFRHAQLTTTPLRNIEADGEVVSATPAEFQIIADAISVLT